MATYKIVSHGGNGLPLNVETTSTISGRTNVNIWKDTGSNDQKWSINSLGTSQQVRTLNNTTYIHTSIQRTIEAMASKFALTKFGATALPSRISVVLAPPLAEP